MGTGILPLDYLAAGCRPRRISLLLKLGYTLFCSILVPYYWWAYGPANFLYFCDVALLVTAAALWLESPLLVSMQALAILMGQTLWIFDFLWACASGHAPLGLAGYMFYPSIPLLVRGLSSFHLWLPFLLVYLLRRLGYDRRALVLQTLACWGILIGCFFLPARVNIDYVRGLSDKTPQTVMPPVCWLGMLMVLFPAVIYAPTHLVLRRLFGEGREGREVAGGRETFCRT